MNAICTAHFITVTHTLHLSAKKHIIMCFSDKKLLSFATIVKGTILFTNELSASGISVVQ